ncbi:MAG: SDR family NAD(P)-dependent oxidoreductase [Bacteroidales bacterium]
MTQILNKTALITGGCLGIGLLTGQLLLERGLGRLIVWDLHTADALSKLDPQGHYKDKIAVDAVDISQVDQVTLLVEKYSREGIVPDILINNAGIVVGKYFVDHSVEDIRKTLDVNVFAHMLVTRLWLPEMMKKEKIHLVNVASAASYIGNRKMSVYAASKWAMHGWSDSLRLELASVSSDFKVSLINPFYIRTGMFEGVKSGWWLPILKPEKVARAIVRAIEHNQRVVRMPFLVRLTPALRGLLPLPVFDSIAGLLGVYKTMDSFIGRDK